MINENTSSSKRRRVTIRDVAYASGVSYATVSRVLSGYEFVKETTRTRVMEAVEDLGYVANLHARSLVGGRSRIIGLLVPNLDNGYVGTITQGIDRELARANFDLMLYTTHRHPGNGTLRHVANAGRRLGARPDPQRDWRDACAVTCRSGAELRPAHASVRL